MATVSFKALLDAAGNSTASGSADKTGAMSKTATVAAVAVLTADAASPTQGHVVTAQAALDALVIQLDAAQLASASGVVVTIDKATITTMDKLRVALRAIIVAAAQSGEFPS